MEVSFVNATVQRGSYFEIQAERFSPNVTDGHIFGGIVCGFERVSNSFTALTQWNAFLKSMQLLSQVDPDYRGRVSVERKTTLRIKDATFLDENRHLFCRLSYYNGSDLMSMTKSLKLNTVYGK